MGFFRVKKLCYRQSYRQTFGLPLYNGFLIGRERDNSSINENGGLGRGCHFHSFILFDGQKEKNGYN